MYTTVYDLDISTLWKAYLFAPSGGVEILILMLGVTACTVYAVWRRRPIFLLPWIPLAMFLSFWLPFILRELQWGRTLLDLYRTGHCLVAEGAVHVQAQQRQTGHSIDKITVGTVPLQISHFELGPQYRDSIVFGGALKEGVTARVWYCPAAVLFRSDGSGPVVRVDIKDFQGR